MKRLASLLTVAALVATACSSSTTTPVPGASVAGSAAPTTASQATPVNGGNLVGGRDGDMVFADPSLVSDGNSLEVAAQVVEGLVGLKPGTINQVIPVLAASLPTVSSDGKTYTFKQIGRAHV